MLQHKQLCCPARDMCLFLACKVGSRIHSAPNLSAHHTLSMILADPQSARYLPDYEVQTKPYAKLSFALSYSATPPKWLLACGCERISPICYRENSSSLISWTTLVCHCGSILYFGGGGTVVFLNYRGPGKLGFVQGFSACLAAPKIWKIREQSKSRATARCQSGVP
jgi:hypothetical protein